MKLVFATNNENKLREARNILPDVDIISLRDAGVGTDIEETGATFEENARIKAIAALRLTGLPAFADDSGLCVDALGGEPGVRSARYTGSHGDPDGEKCRYLLEKLEGERDRAARFVCSVCCVFPEGGEILAEGVCQGTILESPRGQNGFGYDPVFQPSGFSLSMAELTEEEKNGISHRGRALRRLKALLDAGPGEKG